MKLEPSTSDDGEPISSAGAVAAREVSVPISEGVESPTQSIHETPTKHARQTRSGKRGESASSSWPRWLGPVALLLGCATLLVGSDVIEHALFPAISIAWHHALLTTRAGVVTVVGCAIVYALMRRRQVELSRAARHLSTLLESYQANPGAVERFENPHLVHCRDVLSCNRTECPMFDAPGERCWQIVGLQCAGHSNGAPEVDIHTCHECKVYRMSCPDAQTELGESFNNLMFLLEQEAAQVGRMQSQWAEKEKMVAIGQMAAGIAHEVGNPLSSISSIVQMLKRAKDDTPAVSRLDLIQSHIQRISTTVRQLVRLAKPEVNRWTLIDIGELLEEVVRLVGFDRRARSVKIEMASSNSLPMTYALGDQLQQVFINLTLNALDAMPEGGKLTIRSNRARRAIVVSVADSGCGISPETGRRVFEPFFTTKQVGQGTGLGLAVSYGIIQKHGGSIDFTSEVGKGTTFYVRIPIVEQDPEC